MDRTSKALIFTALLATTTACKMGDNDSSRYRGGMAVDSEDHGFYMKTKRDGHWVPSFCLAGHCGETSSFGYQQLYLTTVEGDELVKGEKFGPRMQVEHPLPSYAHAEGFFLFASGARWDNPEIHRLDGTVDILEDLAGSGTEPLLSRDGTMVAKTLGNPREGGETVFVDTRTLEVLLVHTGEYFYSSGWDEQGRFWIKHYGDDLSTTIAIDPRQGEVSEQSPSCFIGQTSGGQYRASDNMYLSSGDDVPLQFVANPDGEAECHLD